MVVAPRLPWPTGFSDVIVHSNVAARDGHRSYPLAKAGDADAALVLALRLISDDGVARLRRAIGEQDVLLLPVVAEETAGFNAIPDAVAQVLGWELRLEAVAGDIVQINKVGHTRARTFQRIVTPALFAGPVDRGARYVLIDDHVGIGGTLANLKGHVEANGGTVITMTTLTESRDGHRISLRPETLAMLRERHGQPLDQFWKDQFGYGIDCLTEAEAQNLCRQSSVAAIEDFLAQAAVEARGRGLEATVGGEG